MRGHIYIYIYIKYKEAEETYPRTGMVCSFAAVTTARYLKRLSSMVQLIFDKENDSEADAKIATSLAPADTAASKP